MAEIKTKPTEIGVDAFIDAVENPVRREDAKTVDAMMRRVTGLEPAMWGPSIIGYGSYHYKYDSGHEGTMCRIGYSPRKAELVLYVLNDRPGLDDQLAQLGKHKIGKSCLYIKKLADVDEAVLEQIANGAWDEMNRRYPG
ncbi:DUF1801 domain-containing protein [Sphingomonas sp. AOB5]|uniref:DUF1801 domain-containing protein n=1 Tax=Sphingomonas sp. AOB5 TaxID=3034017 RepID=UPI0023F93C7C|nr:DUF1801 domain-containing protein [Sphingomonas sp. AOB5]MDF7777451.1 DUF1801 domain-containing protein [Sphingomonas sp. AOB5]